MAEAVRCSLCGETYDADFPACPACSPTSPSVLDSSPSPTPNDARDPPRQLTRVGDRYAILKELGRGGFGVVLQAKDERLGRLVAIKLLNHVLEQDDEGRRRFQREALILAQLDHPHIVPIYDAGFDEDRPFFVMKWIQGSSLAEQLPARDYSEEDALGLTLQIARALEHAHRRGVLHRDIKPRNILVDRDDNYYLADFGASVAGFLPRLTERGTILGTLHYSSPEALAGRPTEQSDIYSLAAVLYELLWGRPCFTATDPRALIVRICEEVPPLLETPPAHVSKGVADLLGRALAKSPTPRPASVAVLLEELQRLEAAASSTPLRGEPHPTGPSVTELSNGLERLELRLEQLVKLCEGDTLAMDPMLEQLSRFVGDGTAFVGSLQQVSEANPAEPALLTLTLSVSHLANEALRRVRGAMRTMHAPSPLEGFLVRLERSLLAPVSQMLRELHSREAQTKPSEDFFAFEERSDVDGTLELSDWRESLLAPDVLMQHEAVLAFAGRELELYVAALRALPNDERQPIFEALWQHADVVLLEARGRSRLLFDAAIDIVSDQASRARWNRLFDYFSKSQEMTHDEDELTARLEEESPADRRVFARAFLFHPSMPFRRAALSVLEPADYWFMISHPSTPIGWLVEVWRHLRAHVDDDFLKVFFVAVHDNLLAPGDSKRITAVVEMVKQLYEVDVFHEDMFYQLLVELDEAVRENARAHHLLVDFDSEYVERLQSFISGGRRSDVGVSQWRLVPLPVQRRLAGRGHFIKYFVCHPKATIALECLKHLLPRDNVVEFLQLSAINGRLLIELAKEKRFFQQESSRYALVANPKTPASIVVKHISFLRKDSLRRLAASHDVNQFSRQHAKKLLTSRA